MKIYFKVVSSVSLNRATKSTDIILSNTSIFDKPPYIEDISSWNGENYMAIDIGITGKLRINRESQVDINKYSYDFWIDTDLYESSLLTSKFITWNHIRKSHIDSLLSIAIPEVRDNMLSKLLS